MHAIAPLPLTTAAHPVRCSDECLPPLSVSRDGLEQLYGGSCIAGFLPPQQLAVSWFAISSQTNCLCPFPLSGRSTLLHQLLAHVSRIITMPVTHATYMLVAEAQVPHSPPLFKLFWFFLQLTIPPSNSSVSIVITAASFGTRQHSKHRRQSKPRACGTALS